MDFRALLSAFPRLNTNNHDVTSPRTSEYNCIAWAVGKTDERWWPEIVDYWPPNVPRTRTVAAFIAAFETLGYTVCADGFLEPGYEKITIYAKQHGQVPTHAAKQLANGWWTSKLGDEEDIEHSTPYDLESAVYGMPVKFMKRCREAVSRG